MFCTTLSAGDKLVMQADGQGEIVVVEVSKGRAQVKLAPETAGAKLIQIKDRSGQIKHRSVVE